MVGMAKMYHDFKPLISDKAKIGGAGCVEIGAFYSDRRLCTFGYEAKP
jgi:hypothetical protein